MDEAGKLAVTQDRLKKYKPRSASVSKRRSTRPARKGYCSYYGYYISQCISYDTRTVPYTETEVRMELPKGVMEPADLLGNIRRTTSRR
jgi:hypothetical protein